jgi:hypothetical protein
LSDLRVQFERNDKCDFGYEGNYTEDGLVLEERRRVSLEMAAIAQADDDMDLKVPKFQIICGLSQFGTCILRRRIGS